MNLIVSFPRSGQHLTERVLRHFCLVKKTPFSYCEFYSGCRKTPCACGKLFQKQHDIDLKLPVEPSNQYLVLYREDRDDNITSYLRWLKANKKNPPENPVQYYDGFVSKWVRYDVDNVLPISYESILRNPYIYSMVFRFFYPKSDCLGDFRIIRLFMKNEPIRRRQ